MTDPALLLLVDCRKQKLFLVNSAGEEQACYSISTAAKGLGEQEGSGQTPRGWHQICAKFGDQMDQRTAFIARKAQPYLYDIVEMKKQLSLLGTSAYVNRDWILSRILWLSGLEPGINQGSNDHGCVDTKSRYVYIHGVLPMRIEQAPASRGCIGMLTNDIVELFNQVTIGCPVYIASKLSKPYSVYCRTYYQTYRESQCNLMQSTL